MGHYFGRKPGHELNSRLMAKLFEERGSWSYTTVEDFETLMGITHRTTENQDMVQDDFQKAAMSRS